MKPFTAARLIELLAKHIKDHGIDASVMLWPPEGGVLVPVMRCWWSEPDGPFTVGSKDGIIILGKE